MTPAEQRKPHVAVIDYGLGNLFSIQQACAVAGLSTELATSPAPLQDADAIILPGVGAFGDAMATLRSLDLVTPIRDFAATGKPLIGICLGVQLLMTRSFEFGVHEGLGLIPGEVRPLDARADQGRRLKVPQIGWNRICQNSASRTPWQESLLHGIDSGEFMYFLHSYVVVPESDDVVLSKTPYGDLQFCSSIQSGRVFACQFHPERSGAVGLNVYKNLSTLLTLECEK